jgi:dTDP-4-dehydrorhamnose 3,5-epimerase-like enzyme
MQRIDAYMAHNDQRGLIRGITQGCWHEINYVETFADRIRGGHYHKETRELFYILDGIVNIAIRNVRTGDAFAVTASAGDIILIEPYEHGARCNTMAEYAIQTPQLTAA